MLRLTLRALPGAFTFSVPAEAGYGVEADPNPPRLMGAPFAVDLHAQHCYAILPGGQVCLLDMPEQPCSRIPLREPMLTVNLMQMGSSRLFLLHEEVCNTLYKAEVQQHVSCCSSLGCCVACQAANCSVHGSLDKQHAPH